MAKPELGTKRECPECGAKYYDLGRSPCVCPKCGASFEPDVAPAPRTVKVEKPKAEVKPEVAPATEEVETVSLDELGAAEQDGEESIEDNDEAILADIVIPDEDDDDDPETSDVFLDTEEDDDTDVSDLLGTDIVKSSDEG